MAGRRPIGSGWMLFAAIALFMASGFNAMAGWAMLSKPELFDNSALLYDSLDVLGWVFLTLSLALFVTSILLFLSSPAGRVLGLVLASVNALFWFTAIGSFPIWGATVLFIDFLIIYGLATHPYSNSSR